MRGKPLSEKILICGLVVGRGARARRDWPANGGSGTTGTTRITRQPRWLNSGTGAGKLKAGLGNGRANEGACGAVEARRNSRGLDPTPKNRLRPRGCDGSENPEIVRHTLKGKVNGGKHDAGTMGRG